MNATKIHNNKSTRTKLSRSFNLLEITLRGFLVIISGLSLSGALIAPFLGNYAFCVNFSLLSVSGISFTVWLIVFPMATILYVLFDKYAWGVLFFLTFAVIAMGQSIFYANC